MIHFDLTDNQTIGVQSQFTKAKTIFIFILARDGCSQTSNAMKRRSRSKTKYFFTLFSSRISHISLELDHWLAVKSKTKYIAANNKVKNLYCSETLKAYSTFVHNLFSKYVKYLENKLWAEVSSEAHERNILGIFIVQCFTTTIIILLSDNEVYNLSPYVILCSFDCL